MHGGVGPVIGQTLFERVVCDQDGQLLTESFMDYAMARAEDVPMMYFDTEATQSLYNPMGMKGCGRGRHGRCFGCHHKRGARRGLGPWCARRSDAVHAASCLADVKQGR